ncbi:dehydrogenase/reductase SDR family member 9-like [Uloborus diversus]|uniref:dehydrogenase/reductase SDR family member 9-like n=1 Tax=Uloborus diversus TaxID=327109 RepID=UPI00240A5911|nr:dehydrogenase/reductase SDR family member 9-like [Uloborus diversus]
MLEETGTDVANFLTALLLDIRVQVLLIFVGFFIHWNYRLPRPRKGAGNKAVFVTGCDTGMGHRMARRFDEMGMHVFAGCLNPSGPGAVALKESCSTRLHVVPLDITNEEQVKEAAAYVKANLPEDERGLYCLVNNAGVLSYTSFDLMTTEMCEEVISVNLMGTIRMTKIFLPLITPVPGRVVTITSILARLVCPRVAVYTATKHALNGFFSALRYELMDSGVHVATIEPGDYSTTTDIMQWTQSRVEEMWEKMSPEERRTKAHLFEDTKKRVHKAKCSTEDQERNYRTLLEDVEDAMLAEEPRWRYVSAPFGTKAFLWVLRMLPEEMSFKVMGRANN